MFVQVGWNTAPKRVRAPFDENKNCYTTSFKESGCLRSQPKAGGKFHLRLNNGERPIANK